MIRRRCSVRLACNLILSTAGLLLSHTERSEWMDEWRGELHHVFAHGVGLWTCIVFTLGSVPDAFWIRRHSHCPSHRLESPRHCLVLLAVCAGLIATLAFLVPQVRQDIFPPPYEGPSDLVTVAPVPSVTGSAMEISASQYLAWSEHTHPALFQTSFYLPVQVDADLGMRKEPWHLGEAASTFPALLHLTIPEALIEACRYAGARPIILSHEAWLRDFSASPDAVGRGLHLSGHRAIIVGVAPAAASDFPEQMDAWSLETDLVMRRLASQRFAYGYMLAQRAPAPASEGLGRESRLELISDDGARTRLYLIELSSLAEYHRRIPEINFLLSLFITCLILPAILAISLRTALRTERLSIRMRTRGWIFLGAKMTLLLALLFCGPLLIAHALAAGSLESAYTLQTFITLIASPLAAFWIVNDQWQRCPHCLRRLTNPVRVGERSRSFLAFSGIEYVCAEGHGLLHVPDFPTSWFASQRWLALDASWRVLFQHGR
jgi:hypothetical protein